MYDCAQQVNYRGKQFPSIHLLIFGACNVQSTEAGRICTKDNFYNVIILILLPAWSSNQLTGRHQQLSPCADFFPASANQICGRLGILVLYVIQSGTFAFIVTLSSSPFATHSFALATWISGRS